VDAETRARLGLGIEEETLPDTPDSSSETPSEITASNTASAENPPSEEHTSEVTSTE
jgi:hypothetical protein